MGRISASKYCVMMGWDDVPHLTKAAKDDLLSSTPPHLKEARSKGIPSMGAGAIYPISIEEVSVDPFPIPAFWRRGYGFDVGWNKTAAIWLAEDPADGTLYAYAEHYKGEAIPAVHTLSIKARGDWIRGAIDPASRSRSQDEGKQLFVTYATLGLHLVPAVNAVDEGLYEVWSRLETGRLKLFTTLVNTKSEYRLYRRNEKGKVVKKFDHLMDALRYAVMTFGQIGKVKPPSRPTNSAVPVVDERAGY